MVIPSMTTDPRDTPAQKRILRSSATARKVRQNFPAGTRIRSSAGTTGTVLRHVPGLSADGGYLVIQWDNPPFGDGIGRLTLTSQAITKIED